MGRGGSGFQQGSQGDRSATTRWKAGQMRVATQGSRVARVTKPMSVAAPTATALVFILLSRLTAANLALTTSRHPALLALHAPASNVQWFAATARMEFTRATWL